MNTARLKLIVVKPAFWFGLFALLGVLSAVQSILLGDKTTHGIVHSHYNNYVIFKYAFRHLMQGVELYAYYPAEHFDIYKYSPAFALAFGFFNALPDWLGLSIFNVLNAVALVYGLHLLPGLPQRLKVTALGFSVIEMLTSIQNSQCNGLITGLLILAVANLERERIALAVLCVMITVYIKLFGVVAFSLFLFYPGKGRMIIWGLIWAVFFSLVPLVVVSPEALMALYKSWWKIISEDHGNNYGFSMIGWLHYWFGLNPNKLLIQVLGVLSFILPLLQWNKWKNQLFRYRMLALVLLWVIIFNHMSESPTLVIAVCGASLWFSLSERNRSDWALMLFCLLLTSLSSTDLFPYSLRSTWIYPKVMKVFPLICIWLKLMYELFSMQSASKMPAADQA